MLQFRFLQMQSTSQMAPHSGGLRYGDGVRTGRIVVEQRKTGDLVPFETPFPLPAVLGIFIGYHLVKWVRLRLRSSRVLLQQSHRDHFQMSIQMVSDEIYNHQTDAVLSTNIEPQSGYFDCSFREFQIYDKKTSEVFVGPASEPGTVRRFQNKLDFNDGTPNYDMKSITGTRSAPGEGHFAIEQGCVATATGEAYWVEISSKVCYLVRGTFQNDSGSFNGEWLSSDGARGSYGLEPKNRSTLPRTSPEDGVPVV